MCDSLEQRVSNLETILGLDAFEVENVSFDVAPICSKLKELNLGFVLETPIQKLHRLKSVFTEGVEIPLKDKIRSINFSSGLIHKRVELLENLQKSSNVVFESNRFANCVELAPCLDKVGADVENALKVISRFETDFFEFYEDLQTLLGDLRSQVDEIKCNLKVLEARRFSKS